MSGKPRLLDLYCGAGGAAKGYQRAGFYVVGVDHRPQPNYCGDEFVQGDALAFMEQEIGSGAIHGEYGERFDAIHASPPCQFATDYIRCGNVGDSPNLIPPTREALIATGLPYVIENVERTRPELRDPILLCGSMFDLDIQRHRLFEANWPLAPHPWPCRHRIWGPDRFPGWSLG